MLNKYWKTKTSKSKFALAEYNLGYLSEKQGNINEAFDFYIQVSDHENEPLIFHNNKYYKYENY